MASTLSAILTAVKNALDALALSECEEIAIRAEPKDGGEFYHGITVSQVPETEHAGTNERDDLGYGIQLTMVVSNDVDPTEDDRFATWRQTIRKALIHQPLSAVDNVYTCLVEHGPIYAKIPEHLDVGTMVLRFLSRETRT